MDMCNAQKNCVQERDHKQDLYNLEDFLKLTLFHGLILVLKAGKLVAAMVVVMS